MSNLEKPIKKMLDITPGKGAGADWALGGSHAPSRNWGAHKDKTGKNAKAKALSAKMGKDKLPPMSEKRKAGILKALSGRYSTGYTDKLLRDK